MKAIGPSFYDELKAAGITGLPFAWGADGDIEFNERMTTAQIAAVEAVYTAHNPATIPALPPPDPIDDLRIAMNTDPTLLNKLKALK